MNALTHGLLARIVLMQDESPEAFHDLVNQHVARFLPADGVEVGFVEEMASAAWRRMTPARMTSSPWSGGRVERWPSPLAQLTSVDPDESTAEAIGDWH
jgi:hypothetical protein